MKIIGNGNTANTVQVEASCLLVCLCDMTQTHQVAGGVADGWEICPEHRAVKLQSLIERDTNCLLHVYDDDKQVMPLRRPYATETPHD